MSQELTQSVLAHYKGQPPGSRSTTGSSRPVLLIAVPSSGFKKRKHFGLLTHERGIDRLSQNIHYSLHDNPEETSSHHDWVFSNDKVFVTIFVKTGKMFSQMKHKRNKKTCSVKIISFQHKTNHQMLVFQSTSCSHEAKVRELNWYCVKELVLYSRQR